jgi:hypothetical protein
LRFDFKNVHENQILNHSKSCFKIATKQRAKQVKDLIIIIEVDKCTKKAKIICHVVNYLILILNNFGKWRFDCNFKSYLLANDLI